MGTSGLRNDPSDIPQKRAVHSPINTKGMPPEVLPWDPGANRSKECLLKKYLLPIHKCQLARYLRYAIFDQLPISGWTLFTGRTFGDGTESLKHMCDMTIVTDS